MASEAAAMVTKIASSVWYEPDFLTALDEASIVAAISQIPVVPFDRYDPRRGFTFTELMIDGQPVTGRLESAAGDPIWWDGGAAAGTAMPPWASDLARRCDAWVMERVGDCAHRGLTSVYIDRYGPGGTFVPHTDRHIYGPIVVGVSVGPGKSTLRFTRPDQRSRRVDVDLTPRSIYAFGDDLRRAPWVHEVLNVNDVRFGVTFRTPATP